MSLQLRQLTTLRFVGQRFEDHGLDLDVLPELNSYQRLLVETAKEIWRQQHPARERLPRGFPNVRIKFFKLLDGSTSIPLMRESVLPEGALPLQFSDELDEAAELIDRTISAAEGGDSAPEAMPRSILPLFEEFGKTLEEGERIEFRSERRLTMVGFDKTICNRILAWVTPTYEDIVDLVGEVRSADLDGCSFAIRLDDGRKVPGHFERQKESLFTEALRQHESQRLRIRGSGEFAQYDGRVRKIIRLDSVEITSAERLLEGDDSQAIWEIVAGIGASVPIDEWAKVPSDFAENLDHYLYGTPKREK